MYLPLWDQFWKHVGEKFLFLINFYLTSLVWENFVGATLLCGPGLLEKLILPPPPPTIVFFVVEGPGERAAISLYSSISTTLLTFDEF